MNTPNSSSFKPNCRILIAGGTSDLAAALVPRLLDYPIQIGIHGFTSISRLQRWLNSSKKAEVKIFQSELTHAREARQLVFDFIEWAGGIDILIQLNGNINTVVSWDQLSENAWMADLNVNLTAPFFLAQAALPKMSDGGRAVFMSTASTKKGGGPKSLAYGIAKSGVETMVKGLARFCADRKILINAICPGFINTRFQSETAGKTASELDRRAKMVPLGCAGTPTDIANVIFFLISNQNQFITGQCIRIDGGDFI